jgi:beta-ureidopropionase / N-carbamoyl-L-amino-acid hydrolase
MTTISIPTIDTDRLSQSITTLAEIGRLPHGGVCRIAYSPEDLKARKLIQQLMREAGMFVRIDAAGNVIGTYAGQNPDAPAIATGSHIDTVPTGGRYDGALGVLAGIEVVRSLRAHQIRPVHPIEVIAFTDEEGGMIGCKAISGSNMPDPEYYRRDDGTSIEDCLKRIGGNWEKLKTALRSRANLAAFVELHVEQGGVLETYHKQVGVVEGIVGQHRYIIVVKGRPNHAGTTPMHLRKDALIAASQIVLTVNQLALELPGQQVATVGAMQIFPNAANIVPGRVEMTVDMRDLDQTNLEAMVEELHRRLAAIAVATQTEITTTPILRTEAVLATPRIQQVVTEVCKELQLSHLDLPSRASHDAQELGRITDMGMIFVPSQSGISHAEDEYTSPEQCGQGVQVLLQTLLKLDQLYS